MKRISTFLAAIFAVFACMAVVTTAAQAHPDPSFAAATLRGEDPTYAPDKDVKAVWDTIENNCINDSGTGHVDIVSSAWTSAWYPNPTSQPHLLYVRWRFTKANGAYLYRDFYASFDGSGSGASTYHDDKNRSAFCGTGPLG